MEQNNKKGIILFLIISGIVTTNNYAQMLHEEIKIETTSKAGSAPDGWQFELYNKSSRNLTVSLETIGMKSMFSNRNVPSMGFVRASYSGNQFMPIRLTINGIIYEITPKGKTVYVSFSDEKGLYPQTGRLMGLLGKTESGLDNKNNINASAIKKIVYKPITPSTPSVVQPKAPKPPVTTYLPGESRPRKTETTKTASKANPWTFELRNPTTHSVTFTLKQTDGTTVLSDIVVDPRSVFRATVDTKQDFRLRTTLTVKIPVDVLQPFLGKEKKSTNEIILSPKGKTMFLEIYTAIDPSSYKIIPAEPAYPKNLNQTFSGLSLSNNIGKEHIR